MTGNAERGIEELKKLGRICRGDIIKMTTIANSGHPGLPMGAAIIRGGDGLGFGCFLCPASMHDVLWPI